mgnify:CR=1 FL=1
MYILGMESSCDETSAAIIEAHDGILEIRSNIVASQIETHRLYGGVVPEIASRRHAEAISGVVEKALEDADCMLPYRWRKVSPLTLAAKTKPENEPMRNGIDREWDGQDNGVYTIPGEENITYHWDSPVQVSQVRFIFDSDLKVRGKRMRKLEATTERVEMPSEMARDFLVQVRVPAKNRKERRLFAADPSAGEWIKKM